MVLDINTKLHGYPSITSTDLSIWTKVVEKTIHTLSSLKGTWENNLKLKYFTFTVKTKEEKQLKSSLQHYSGLENVN